ncbi:hypothetical protein RclHR1_12370010 [Rhizophagus clarus]|uniref:Uncharacterized protein n=1 Tax=Rhizophagus clarus TaxID=94130 RepID=A0A2Z6QM31_9GLOM|nr:hypothetical protein RclHR1_12370010 [Rhizophagus clarus]GES96505.1 hypothetical protein GLOIN_2v1773466 [Rhizophagus clarus]
MEEAAHSVISHETEEIGSSSTQSQQKSPIIPVDDSTIPNMDIDQPEISKKSPGNADKQDSSNESHHNKTRSSGSNTKTKNSNKIPSKAVEKIYVNNEIPDDKKYCVRIFSPISWTQQNNIWQYSLCGQAVRWFPGNWTFQQRKKREQFCLYLNELPQESHFWQLWDHTKPSELFTNHIKSLKHFNTAKGSHIVAYFEKYQDVEKYHKISFTFNHNEVNTTLD